MTRFTKLGENTGFYGGWEFKVGDKVFVAIRNTAGFAGRDWELWRRNGELLIQEADQLASRGECVAFARYGFLPYKA